MKIREGDTVRVQDDICEEDLEWVGIPAHVCGKPALVRQLSNEGAYMVIKNDAGFREMWWIPYELLTTRRCMFDSIS